MSWNTTRFATQKFAFTDFHRALRKEDEIANGLDRRPEVSMQRDTRSAAVACNQR